MERDLHLYDSMPTDDAVRTDDEQIKKMISETEKTVTDLLREGKAEADSWSWCGDTLILSTGYRFPESGELRIDTLWCTVLRRSGYKEVPR